MSDRVMIPLDRTLVEKIDACRGQLNRGDFIRQSVESWQARAASPERPAGGSELVTREEFDRFKNSLDQLYQEFIDIFARYSRHLDEPSPVPDLEQFTRVLKNRLALSSK
ncbi:MAG: hypothetical protein HYX96_03210 [Chloroflexi bacterium]|nr:hypothetical protein [Chloroflexota bacterium]